MFRSIVSLLLALSLQVDSSPTTVKPTTPPTISLRFESRDGGQIPQSVRIRVYPHDWKDYPLIDGRLEFQLPEDCRIALMLGIPVKVAGFRQTRFGVESWLESPPMDEIAVTLSPRGELPAVWVVDTEGQPIADAVVEVSDDLCTFEGGSTTDEQGLCECESLRNQLGVRVAAAGYMPIYLDSALSCAVDDKIRVELQKAFALRVQVVDHDGRPMPGVGVCTFGSYGTPRILPTGSRTGKDGVTIVGVRLGTSLEINQGQEVLGYFRVPSDSTQLVELQTVAVAKRKSFSGKILVDGEAESGWLLLEARASVGVGLVAKVEEDGSFEGQFRIEGVYAMGFLKSEPHRSMVYGSGTAGWVYDRKDLRAATAVKLEGDIALGVLDLKSKPVNALRPR